MLGESRARGDGGSRMRVHSPLNVQLVSPGGEVQATGKVDIAPNTPDCVPPVPTE